MSEESNHFSWVSVLMRDASERTENTNYLGNYAQLAANASTASTINTACEWADRRTSGAAHGHPGQQLSASSRRPQLKKSK